MPSRVAYIKKGVIKMKNEKQKKQKKEEEKVAEELFKNVRLGAA